MVTPASPQIITVNNGEEFHFCGDSSRSTGNVLQFESGGQGEVTLGVGNSDNPCPAAPPPRGAYNYRNETPYFFDMQTANNSIFISNLASAFNPNIPYGEHPNADGANTSSLGLINGTTPFGYLRFSISSISNLNPIISVRSLTDSDILRNPLPT